MISGFQANVDPWTRFGIQRAADTEIIQLLLSNFPTSCFCCPPRGINKELQHNQKTHLLMLGGSEALDTVSSSLCLPVFSPVGYELLPGFVQVFVPLDEIYCSKHTEPEQQLHINVSYRH